MHRRGVARDRLRRLGGDAERAVRADPLGGGSVSRADDNASLGPNRRQWMRWEQVNWIAEAAPTPIKGSRWVPVELREVREGDVILTFDVHDGDMENVDVFVAGKRTENGVLIVGAMIGVEGNLVQTEVV